VSKSKKIKFFQGLLAALFFFAPLGALYAGAAEDITGLRWHLLKLEPAHKQLLEILAEADIEISGTTPDGALMVIASPLEKRWLENRCVSTSILIEDYGRALAERNQQELRLAGVDEFANGSMAGYFSPEEVAGFVDSLIAQDRYGIISKRYFIGTSYWDSLWVVKVSDNVEVDEDEPEVFYNSLIHAREPMSLMSLLYFLRFVVKNYGRADSVTDLVNSRELFFMPLVNPDGYEINWRIYAEGSRFGLWRKNARDNNGNGVLDFLDGVDLNRNFAFQWGIDEVGSSGDPRMENYRGPSFFSEPESRTLRDFINAHSFVTALNGHTYGAVLINPFGYTNLLTPDSMLYKALGARLTAENGYKVGNVARTLGSYYRVNGELTDWEYADTTERGKIIAWSLEVGTRTDGFWPPVTRITPLARENLSLLFSMACISGFWPELDSLVTIYESEDSTRIALVAKLSNVGLRANQEPLTLRLENKTKGLTLIDSLVYLVSSKPDSSGIFAPESLRAAFEKNCFSSWVSLAVYEGDQRIRSFRIKLERPYQRYYDLNRDGRINIFDLLTMLRVLAYGVPPGGQPHSYDVNGDGALNILDLIALLAALK